jgi:hypothetical protein
MTTQISDSILICEHQFYVPHFAYLPTRHPLLAKTSEYMSHTIPALLKKSTALHRGYVAEWEVREDGRLFLNALDGRYRMKGGPIHAKWISTVTSIPVGEVDETKSRTIRYEIVRVADLELTVQKGNIARWRLVFGDKKGQRWKNGFDWESIAKAMALSGIGPEYQPARHSPKWVHGDAELAELAAASANLLKRARNGATDCGRKLEEEDWSKLRRGWADPFPGLDFHETVLAFRGQAQQFKAKLP